MITTTTIAVRQGTAEDLPAVRRFWYEVYCEQMGRLTGVACGHAFSMALHLDDREYLEALNSPFLWTALDKH